MKLMIMRHGEAEPYGGAASDATRCLTAFGRERAAWTGTQLKELAPELVLISPFLRTRETAELVMQNLSNEPERSICDWLLSEASVPRAVSEIEKLTAEKVLIVSHMPFVSLLLEYFTGTRRSFSPAEVAMVEMEWVGFEQGECHWVT